MILKNCCIFDEYDGKEKLVDFIFEDEIIDYSENLLEQINIDDKEIVKLKYLSSEKIDAINKVPNKYIIDTEGMIAIPGGIDPHVHFDTPGYTHREDFYHGSMSAAAGGITTVIDMPCTSLPPVTNGDNFDKKFAVVKNSSVVDFAFYGGIDANNFESYSSSMEQLADKGVKGFKTYFVSGMESYPRVSKYQFFKIMKKAKELSLPVLLHAEDFELLDCLERDHRNDIDDYLHYCSIRPSLGEVLAVSSAIEITKALGGKLHIVHVASGLAAQLLNLSVKEHDISYETCPHYLYFTFRDFETKGSALKTAPVVKDEFDLEKLWKYLSEGFCSFVASDHAPAPLIEKNTGSFMNDYSGIPGTQTMLPLVFSEGYKKRNFSLKNLIEITSKNAAIRYKLYPQKGSLKKGTDADIVLVNPNKKYKFEKEQLFSKGGTSPFDGEEFEGKIILSILRGKIIYHENCGITIEKGYGSYI